VPLHEWKTFTTKDALSDNIITWVFEEDSFSPIAKIKKDKQYSIINDHLGTPIEAYADDGKLIWERSLNSNGKVLKETGFENFCQFLYQGQSFDSEIELAYNRFRYYNPEEGRYISQDPIGLLSGELGFYNYVEDPNGWVDVFGLAKSYNKGKHGNRKGLQRAEGYSLRDRTTGRVRKFGETTRGDRKFGSGKQRRYSKTYLDNNNLDYVKETQGSKKRMHKWQHDKIVDFKSNNGGNRPDLNKSDY
jgi:RHS repeat-associated protein